MLSTNLAAYWDFDEQGGTVADRIGTNHLTEQSGTPLFEAGKVRGCRTLVTASTEWLQVNDNTVIGPTGPFTISGWFKVTAATTNVLVSKAGAGGQFSYVLQYTHGTGVLMRVSNNGSTVTAATQSGNLTAGQWYHVAGGYDGSVVWVQLNGGTRQTTNFSAGIFDSTAYLSFGWDGAPYTGASFDEWGFWNGRSLSSAEVIQLYNGGLGMPLADVLNDGAATVTTRRQQAIFDGAVTGTVTPEFRRNVAVTERGITYAANEPRFADHNKLVISPPEWVDKQVIPTGSGQQILATGWNHDDSKKLVAVIVSSAERLVIYEWDEATETFTQLSNNTFTQLRTAVGGNASYTYATSAVGIHHGLIVANCMRRESGVLKGITCIYSQDGGVTWSYLAENGGTGDWPPVADGRQMLARWSGPMFFPYENYSDKRAVFSTTTDYIANVSPFGFGGQVWGFKATRTTDTGLWTVQNARKLWEHWDETIGGHFHSAAFFRNSAGDDQVLVAVGDTAQRNYLTLLSFDADNYLTDTIDVADQWHGGRSADVNTIKPSPQPVMFQPHPDGGSLASGDETFEVVQYYGRLTSPSNTLAMRSRINCHADRTTLAPLLLTHLHDVGYCAAFDLGGDVSGLSGWLSFDGEAWGEIPSTMAAVPYLLSHNRLVAISTTANTLAVTKPIKARQVRPLKINPGARNLLGTAYAINDVAVGSGNTVTPVYWDSASASYKKVSDNTVISGSPSVPPPAGDGLILDVDCGTSDYNLGRWWVQNSGGGVGNVLNGALHGCANMWCYSLTPQVGIHVNQLVQYNTASNQSLMGALINHDVHSTGAWEAICQQGTPTASGSGRAMHLFYSTSNSAQSFAHRYLLCFGGLYNANHPPYHSPRQATNTPDEILRLINLPSTSSWTTGATYWRPKETGHTQPWFLLSIVKDGSNYVRVRYLPATTQLEVQSVVGGSVVATNTHTLRPWYINCAIRLRVASDGTNLEYTCEQVGGLVSGSIASGAVTAPKKVVVADPVEGNVSALEVAGLSFTQTYEGEAQRTARLRNLYDLLEIPRHIVAIGGAEL